MFYKILFKLGILPNRGAELYEAIRSGNESNVTEILNSDACPTWNEIHTIGSSINDALSISGNNIAIIKTLHDHFGTDIQKYNVLWALDNAVRQEHNKAAELLLEHHIAKLTPSDKRNLIEIAVKYGKTTIFNLFLDCFNEDLNAHFPHQKGFLLESAALDGYTDIVESLLTRCTHEITNESKALAIRAADVKHHLDCKQIILNDPTYAQPEPIMIPSSSSEVYTPISRVKRNAPEPSTSETPNLIDDDEEEENQNSGHLKKQRL
jgi:hypothetical protein